MHLIKMRLKNDLFNLFFLGCWRLWTNRNTVTHGSIGWATADMVAWIDGFTNKLRVANKPNHKEILSHRPTWKPPNFGGFMINCDASFQLRSGKTGVGIIILDHKAVRRGAYSLDGSIVWLEELSTDVARLVRLDSASFGCFV
ncbi:hypothetical protein Ddye_031300 [Dipteronia dyeriana]|uniref:RNase H type-1 domain-containing protein n=1 Tax=Dipteronia dyeriana TaxID=168575 RepID=A0AAD9TIL1_9ROSI|nr:hypothetical protein Ddye_031300 [Dipteronia dyeriana]